MIKLFVVCIKLLGEVSFENPAIIAGGYKCDVPCDWLGIPYIPTLEFLGGKKWNVPNVKIGSAHPEGYVGFMKAAYDLHNTGKDRISYIASFFTEEHFDKKNFTKKRSLKAGQIFQAFIDFPQAAYQEIEDFLKQIKQIGVSYDGITGEVECYLEQSKEEYKTEIDEKADYCALDYSIRIISPVCFHTPYDSNPETYLYAPGSVIKNEFCDPAVADKMIFTNAYIMNDGVRLLPMPVCAALVKLEPDQFRYSISAGKKADKTEQITNINNAFTVDFLKHFVRYVCPETVRITSGDNKNYDALAGGQALGGTVYGTNEQLRNLAAQIDKKPLFSIGTLTEEGYGEVYIQVTNIRDKNSDTEILAKRFDVICHSNTLIIADNATPAYGAQNLLAEIERLLKAPGKLKIDERFIDVKKVFGTNENFEKSSAVLRCVKAGSILRLSTVDGKPVDISPLLHAFIGEMTADGYGEISAYPAVEGYYRLAKQLSPEKRIPNRVLTIRDMSFGVNLTRHVLNQILKKRVRFLAVIDRDDYRSGISADELLPTVIFEYMQKTYYPDLPLETMEAWYKECLEAEDNVDDFA